jgi:hypothetical protein
MTREIRWEDLPPIEYFEEHVPECLHQGITNADRMREAWLSEHELHLGQYSNKWSETPSGTFVNRYAFALKELVEEGIIERVAEKEYRFPIPEKPNQRSPEESNSAEIERRIALIDMMSGVLAKMRKELDDALEARVGK